MHAFLWIPCVFEDNLNLALIFFFLYTYGLYPDIIVVFPSVSSMSPHFQVSPNAFSKLRYLETLDLSHNNLESLPPSCFTGLPLTEVDLSHNSFQEFYLDVFAAKVNGEPVRVDLSYNKLVSLSMTLHGKVLHVQSLNLTANRMSSVPNLAGLPLRYLNLDGNPITCIQEGTFAQLKDLVYLSISGLHELQEIEAQSFRGLQSLQVLDLSNNPKLSTLNPAVFSGLDSLQELNLSGSGVTFLPSNMLTYLPSIKSITLGRNIRCWRTQKQGQFHRQLGQVQHDEVLNCNVEGIVLWTCARRNGLLLTVLMPELCLLCFDMQNTFLCYPESITSVPRLEYVLMV